jgi:hypothetical protein
MLWDEASLVVERVNAMEITRSTLMQLAISSILSKKAGKEFEKRVASLNMEAKPREAND